MHATLPAMKSVLLLLVVLLLSSSTMATINRAANIFDPSHMLIMNQMYECLPPEAKLTLLKNVYNTSRLYSGPSAIEELQKDIIEIVEPLMASGIDHFFLAYDSGRTFCEAFDTALRVIVSRRRDIKMRWNRQKGKDDLTDIVDGTFNWRDAVLSPSSTTTTAATDDYYCATERTEDRDAITGCMRPYHKQAIASAGQQKYVE